MTQAQSVLLVWMLIVLSVFFAFGQNVQDSFPLAFERVDVLSTDQQAVFSTKATPRGGLVMVFRDGLLQTLESNPGRCPAVAPAPRCGDYTSAGAPGKQVITFITPLPGNEWIGLIYFR